MTETFNCPFCTERKGSPDTTGHLYLYGEDRGYHCFRGAPPEIARESSSISLLDEDQQTAKQQRALA